MASTTTSTTNFSDLVVDLILAAERNLRDSLPHTAAGEYVPGRFDPGTNTIRIPYYADLAIATTALTEGAAPTSQSLTIDSEALTATQYGATVSVTDLAQFENPSNLVQVAAERVARQAALTMDTLVRDVLAAGTNVLYSGTATARTAVNTNISGALVRHAVAKLRNAAVPTFGDGTYHAIATQGQILDIQADTTLGGWVDAAKYTDRRPLLSGEIGQYFGVRFIEAIGDQAKVFAAGGSSSADVHSAFIYGPGAWMIGDLQTLRAYFTPPGGQGDPLAQLTTVGWKVAFGSMLIQKAGARYVRIESTASSV